MKNKHIRGIIIDIITIALCITAIFVGVFSVKNANLNISGEIGFEKHEPTSYLSSNWSTEIATTFNLAETTESTNGDRLTYQPCGKVKKLSFLRSLEDVDLSNFDKESDGSTLKYALVLDSLSTSSSDIKAYYSSSLSELIVYSDSVISAPANCSDFFAMFKYYSLENDDNYCLLEQINLSNFDTSKVTDMSKMFKGMEKLTSIDLSKFNTSKVTDMSGMFYNCYLLTNLNLSNFDTSNVTDISYMFTSCTELLDLNVTSFTTHNVKHMDTAFAYCKKLTILDLSGFTAEIVQDMRGMFGYCTNLTTIYVSESWSVETQAVLAQECFKNCTSLKGAVEFDSTKTNADMANYTTGYLTLKSA